jgi:hypothetical protein
MQMLIHTDRISLNYLKQDQEKIAVFDNTPLSVDIKIPQASPLFEKEGNDFETEKHLSLHMDLAIKMDMLILKVN